MACCESASSGYNILGGQEWRNDPNALDFYRLLSAKLLAEADLVTSWIGDAHWGEVGRSREGALRTMIASYLPRGLGCGTLYLWDWLLQQCRTDPDRAGEELPQLREYLSLGPPGHQSVGTYRREEGRA